VKAPSVRDEVDCFGCASNENYFRLVFCVDELGNCFPRAFMQFGDFLRQRVDCSVDVGVVVLVKVCYGVDYLSGFLGGCGVVKVD
jgi:hypothetical protein